MTNQERAVEFLNWCARQYGPHDASVLILDTIRDRLAELLDEAEKRGRDAAPDVH